MSRTIEAIYEDGVFKPLGPVDLPERARARLRIEEEGAGAEGAEFREYTGPLPRPFASSGAGASGRSDISERAEELLSEGFGRQ